MRGLLTITLCLIMALSPAAQAAEAGRPEALYALSLELLTRLQAGNEEAALLMMDGTMKGAMAGQLKALWAQLTMAGGEFLETGAWRASEQDGFNIIELTLVFSNVKLIQRTVLDGENQVAGLFFTPGEVPEDEPEVAELPEGVREEAVTVDAGRGYPLEGTLSLPANGEVKAGLVLVHGSGPSDRDEAVLANTPFRDLAWGLAQRSIAVLRFDKRTLVYGQEIAGSPDYPRLTVDEETAQDAAAAVQLLKARPELAGKKAFLLGHSLGGMLTAYINTQGAGADGYINLAGSPRKLRELSAEQNRLLAREALAAGQIESPDAALKQIEAEIRKAEGLLSLSNEEALAPGAAVFGMSAWYLRHLEGIDAPALHLADGLPVLVLQGGRDRQVYMEDYEAWQAALAGHPDASFILYPELNHLFGRYEGETRPFSQIALEYSQLTPIPDEVLDDIAAWISERAQ
ncbi:MAG: alpha/beta fold hydrolase [Eubacteriales bacterium]|nr:alpha/beta fold hydrolase [Eubacteriales bacterium]